MLGSRVGPDGKRSWKNMMEWRKKYSKILMGVFGKDGPAAAVAMFNRVIDEAMTASKV